MSDVWDRARFERLRTTALSTAWATLDADDYGYLFAFDPSLKAQITARAMQERAACRPPAVPPARTGIDPDTFAAALVDTIKKTIAPRDQKIAALEQEIETLHAEVDVYSPVAALLARRAGYERSQLVVQSARRPALQRFLPAWRERIEALPGRRTRWSIDVDPAGFG